MIENNEQRADIGAQVVLVGGVMTGVATEESAETAIKDVLAYVAHFCDRCGLDADLMFRAAFESHFGDFEDGPPAREVIDPSVPLLGRGVDPSGMIH